MKNLFKFRQFESRFISLYLFQKSRWSLGLCLDVDYKNAKFLEGGFSNKENLKYDWSTWLLSIDFVFIYVELHSQYPKL